MMVIGIALFPIIINEAYKLNSGYATLWDAADALAYYGSMLGAVGTIILGIVSWEQNRKLHLIEENSLIANNACIGFINEIVIKDIQKVACNLEQQHDEQIVSTIDEITNSTKYSSYSMEIKMEMKENIAPLIKINHILLQASKTKTYNIVLDFDSIDNKDEYSRIAIYSDGAVFNVTMIASPKEKDELIKILEENDCQLFIEVDLSLLTDKYVSSHLKCRSSLLCNDYSEEEKIYNKFKIGSAIPPKCFWYGNGIVDKRIVKIKELPGMK